MIGGAPLWLLARTAYALCFVSLFAVIGKSCQYVGVALFSGWLGFEGASGIGLAPFIIALLLAKARYPRWFAWRSA